MKNTNDYLLTSEVTLGDLKNWLLIKDSHSKKEIIDLIKQRFNNRYLKHLKKIDSGFLKMGICCLMIETLESFKQGKENTKAKGAGLKMFKDFFESEEKYFPNFKNITSEFYSHIRCGILHQAETTNAWRIRRDGAFLDINEKSINSVKFVKALEHSLNNYINELLSNDFNSIIWKNAIIKLENICNNCQSTT